MFLSNTTIGTQNWNFKIYLKRWNETSAMHMEKIIYITVESLLSEATTLIGLMYLDNNYSNRYHLQTASGAMPIQSDNQMGLLD